jgi:rare lipoprotein A
VLDLSRAAAQNIGMVKSGTAKVCYEVVNLG